MMDMTAQERRPRIRSEVADHVDAQRGQVPFERYVNMALAKSGNTTYGLERGDNRRTFRIRADVMRSRELPPQEAADHAEILNYLATAIDSLMRVQEFSDTAIPVDFYGLTEKALAAVDKIVDAENELLDMEEHED